MKKTFLMAALLCSAGAISASSPFGRSPGTPGSFFGGSQTTPSPAAAPSEPKQPGLLERAKERLGFGQEKPQPTAEPTGFRRVGPSRPTLPQDQPGFFARQKERFGFGPKPVAPQAPAPRGAAGLLQQSEELRRRAGARTSVPSVPADEQKKQILEAYLQNSPLLGELFDVTPFVGFLPHIRQERGTVTFTQIFNLPNRNATKRMVDEAYKRVKDQLKSTGGGLAARSRALLANAKIDNLYARWKAEVYEKAPHKEIWERLRK